MGAKLLKVDWQAVRETWLLTDSFAETAKIHGIADSTAIRVRAGREGWQKSKAEAMQRVTDTGLSITPARVLLRPVTTATVIQDELTQRGSNSRLNAARIADTALANIAEYEPEKLIAALEAANQAGSLAQKGNVPGWERQATSNEQHSHLHLHQAVKPDALPLT